MTPNSPKLGKNWKVSLTGQLRTGSIFLPQTGQKDQSTSCPAEYMIYPNTRVDILSMSPEVVNALPCGFDIPTGL